MLRSNHRQKGCPKEFLKITMVKNADIATADPNPDIKLLHHFLISPGRSMPPVPMTNVGDRIHGLIGFKLPNQVTQAEHR